MIHIMGSMEQKNSHCFMFSEKNKLVRYWQQRGIVRDQKLIDAFLTVPRESFVRPEDVNVTYDDVPQQIGYGQTISQPTTVMFMLDKLELKSSDRVLEIGAGSGYNAALIAQIAKKVIAIEIVPELVEYAKRNLADEKIENVKVIQGDGSQGYPQEAPYNKIIVTAACPKIPPPLEKQLIEGGIIIAPIGDYSTQIMTRGRKKNGKISYENFDYFMFVPLKGKYGFK